MIHLRDTHDIELMGTVIESDTTHLWFWPKGVPLAEAVRIPRARVRGGTTINCGAAILFVDAEWLNALEDDHGENTDTAAA